MKTGKGDYGRGGKEKQDGTRWKRIYKRYEGKFAYFPIISAWHLVRSLFSSTEPGKKIASRSRERNIILMSPGMLRYPLPRIPLSSFPVTLLLPLPSPASSSKPRVMPPTFNPVFVSLRFRVFLCVSLALYLSFSLSLLCTLSLLLTIHRRSFLTVIFNLLVASLFERDASLYPVTDYFGGVEEIFASLINKQICEEVVSKARAAIRDMTNKVLHY